MAVFRLLGSQVSGAIELIENQRGVVIGIATINIDKNKDTNKLMRKYKIESVWIDGQYD